MSDFVSQVGKYIKSDEIEGAIRQIHKGLSITRGSFSSRAPGIVEDMEWNHLDQAHRNFLHDAYHDALRVVTGKDFAFSVTRWGKSPLMIPVFDVRIDRGLFYQSFSVFNFFYVHQVCRLTQDGDDHVKMDINWFIASHWLFKFLHRPLSNRLAKLQAKQNGEDLIVRQRRHNMRRQGFRFKSDDPDFLNSNVNVINDMVIFPTNFVEARFPLKDLTGATTKIKMGPMEFFANKSDQGVEVLPALCPHEGAEMVDKNFCDGQLSCPWHGRKFKAALLKSGSGIYKFSNLRLQIEDGDLVLRPQSPAGVGVGTERTVQP